MLKHGDALLDKIADRHCAEERISDGCKEYDCSTIEYLDTFESFPEDRIWPACHFEFEVRVIVCHLQDRLIHVLWVEHGRVSRCKVHIVDELVLVSHIVRLVYLIRPVLVRLNSTILKPKVVYHVTMRVKLFLFCSICFNRIEVTRAR